MDKEFEKDVKDLERGYELKQEETIHGERIGQTLEMNEELEDKLDLVKKLKKQIKTTRGISIGVLAVLIIVLLYACVTYILHPKQTVTEETITYNMEVPKPDISQVESVTLDELMGTLELPLDWVRYSGNEYHMGDSCPSGVTLYPNLEFAKAFYETKRIYTMNREPLNCTEHNLTGNLGICTVLYCYDPIYASDGFFGVEGVRGIYDYYSLEAFKSEAANYANMTNHTDHLPRTINISIYEESDIDVGSLVKDVLESFDYGEVVIDANDEYNLYFHSDMDIEAEELAEGIIAGLSDVEFSIKIEDFSYTTYDSVEEQEEYTVCFRDGKKHIPDAVKKYNIEVTDYRYNYQVCAVQDDWFTSPVSSQPEGVSVAEQTVRDEELTFVMEVPQIDMGQVESTTLDELMGTLATRKDKVVYLDETYKQGDEYPSGVSLYLAESVEKAFAGAKRVYTLNGEPQECTSHSQGYLPGCFVRYHTQDEAMKQLPRIYYYNDAVLRENTLFNDLEVFASPNHYGHREWDIRLIVYGETEVDISSLIKNTLESFPFAQFLTTEDGYTGNDVGAHYKFGVDPAEVGERIKDGLPDLKFILEVESPSPEYEEYFYSTSNIDDIRVVTNYNVKVVDYDYKSWICGVQEHWFE